MTHRSKKDEAPMKNASGTAYEARMLRIIKSVNSANPRDTTGTTRKDVAALAGYAVRLRAENAALRADRDRLAELFAKVPHGLNCPAQRLTWKDSVCDCIKSKVKL